MDYVLGIDLGTSSIKALLLDQNGTIITSAQSFHKPDFLGNGFVEQNPKVWVDGLFNVLGEIIEKCPDAKGNIVASAVSGQMHSSVFLDSDGNVIRNAILWNDTRTTPQTKEIYEKCGGREGVLKNVYNLALEGFTLPKILWLKENEPENYIKVSKVILPKDYINYILSGEIATDYSDAAGTLMFDVKKCCWSEEILNALDISKDILPKAIESTETVGIVKPEFVEKYGFRKDAKVIAGGADNSCAAIGNGVTQLGKAVVSVGTSGTVIAALDKVQNADGSVHLFNYSLTNSFYAMGCMLSAGESLNWLKRTFFDEVSFDEINRMAQNTKAGCAGVIFLPYLFGERSPHNDPNARGVFFGINDNTDKGVFVRSVMEGVAFALKDLYINVLALTNIEEVYITGGGAKSDVWGQIISDVLNVELKIIDISEGPSFGAGLIALVGANLFEDFNSACKNVKVIKKIKPSENVDKYAKIYEVFKKLYIYNKDAFQLLNSIR